MESRPLKLPVDISSFEKMRSEGYLYVDKTRFIYQIATGGTFYFLSRPRRFGKSLLASTLKSLFEGRKDLFDGLWIADHSDWDWRAHPVVFLDFNEITGQSAPELEEQLAFRLQEIAAASDLTLSAPGVGMRFRELILALREKTGQPVAIVIDEYDKRMIDHLGKGPEHLQAAKEIRDLLKAFFGVLKGQSVSEKLRFVFLTGVSRFSKVSLFSDLNNLIDLSMDALYADMLGYTQQEMEQYFGHAVQQLAAARHQSPDETMQALQTYYNGYRFSERDIRVYNPFSILRAFYHQAMNEYWFESGTPTFLVNVLREQRYYLPDIEQLQVSRTVFTNFELESLWPEALLFQTGYLTIRDVQQEIYTLGYPNHEVKHALTEAFLFGLAAERRAAVSSHALRLPRFLQQEDFAAFFEAVSAIFASIPYDLQSQRDEAYFHTIFYLMMSVSGLIEVQSSVLTSRGRIDLVVEFPDKVCIIEFKCGQSADIALRQIQANRYAEKYRGRGKAILLLGINFDKEQRNVEEWKVQPDSAADNAAMIPIKS